MKLKALDYFGSALFIASVTSLLVAIPLGVSQFPWASWHILVSLCLGAAGLIGVVAYEYRGAAHTFIPVYIFRNYSTTAVYAGSFLHGLVLYSLVYYMPEYFQAVLSYSPLNCRGGCSRPNRHRCSLCHICGRCRFPHQPLSLGRLGRLGAGDSRFRASDPP